VATALYMRVSSTKGQDTRSQEPDLTTWAKAQADDVAWYRDRFTGTPMDRPGLERLLADVRSGKITRVVVWRLDRLGRTAKGLLTLLDELQALGVGFVSPPTKPRSARSASWPGSPRPRPNWLLPSVFFWKGCSPLRCWPRYALSSALKSRPWFGTLAPQAPERSDRSCPHIFFPVLEQGREGFHATGVSQLP
jgi:hypothetical protein